VRRKKKTKVTNPLLPFWFEKKQPTLQEKSKESEKKFQDRPKLRMVR
jgi:hypothetical protein